MAEVIASQRTGVSLGGVDVAAPSPTRGTEGRVAVQGPNLDALTSLFKGAAGMLAGRREAEAAAAEAAALSEVAKQELDIQFDTAAEGTSSTMNTALNEYRNAIGEEIPGNVQSELRTLQAEQALVEQARIEGKGEIAARLKANRTRYRFLTQNPGYAKEAVNFVGNTLFFDKTAAEQAWADERAQEQRRLDAIKQRDEKLGAIYDINSLDEPTKAALWNEETARARRLLQSDQQLKLLQNNKEISSLERETTKREVIYTARQDLYRSTLSGFAEIMRQSGNDPVTAGIKAGGLLAETQTGLMRKLGLSAKEFDEEFGYIWTPLTEQVKGLASGKTSLEAVQTQIQLLDSTAGLDLRNQIPNLSKLGVVDGLLGRTLSPATRDRIYSDATAEAFRTAFSNDPAAGNGDVNYSVDREGKPDPSPTNAQKRIEATQEYVDKLYAAPGLKDDVEAKRATYNMAISPLISPDSLRNFKNVDKSITQIADERFLTVRDGSKPVPERAIATLEEYAIQLDRNTQKLFEEEGDNVRVTMDPDGTVRYTLAKPSKNASKLSKIEQDMNNYVRAYSHLNGSTDYASYVRYLRARAGGE